MSVKLCESGKTLLADLLGESEAIRSLRAKAERLLSRQMPGGRLPGLLILGETGTGKSLLARSIHRASPLESAPFVTVDCGAIPETLVEAELFGFEQGAFTDARRSKPGLFQIAHGGFIFLDEVGLLSKSLQGKLLTVVEEHVVRRLGGTRSEVVDVQVVAATNEDLGVAVSEGRFRSDLYHRLATVTLRVPPLRERGGDIVMLAERFLARACHTYGLAPKVLASECREALQAYRWPGNVRELANIMEQVALMCDDVIVTPDLLVLPGPPPGASQAASAVPLRSSLEKVERDYLLEALRSTNWNLSVTAERLGIPRNTLRYRMVRVGIRPGAPGHRRLEGEGAATAPSRRPRPVMGIADPFWKQQRRHVAMLRVVVMPSVEGVSSDEKDVRTLVPAIGRFGGVVEEADGRAISAMFGLERLEDALGRAAHAAVEIRNTLKQQSPGDASVTFRIALHSWLGVVESSGSLSWLDPESRRLGAGELDGLVAASEPGAIQVSAHTAALLQGRFELLRVGGTGPVAPAYRLVGTHRIGLRAGAWPETPFVARKHELALLETLLAQVEQGRGQVVGIVGTPGCGKSRLLHEFGRRLEERSVALRGAQCTRYGGAEPFSTILQVVREAYGIAEDDSAETITGKVRQGLGDLELEAAEWGRYLPLLFGIGARQRPGLASWPDDARNAVFEVLRRSCVERSKREPLVFQLDDVDRLGKTSEEFLAYLVEAIPGSRIFLVTTCRPGYRPPWIGRSCATQLVLHPLTPQESLVLIDSICPIEVQQERVTRAILDRAEGNPFFLEQLSKSALEHAESLEGLRIPESVRAFVQAEIDELDPRSRQLVVAASAIGRAAPLRILHRVCGEHGSLARRLAELKRVELLEDRLVNGEAACVFRHGLVQAVAYESLTAAERHVLHAAVDRALLSSRVGQVNGTPRS